VTVHISVQRMVGGGFGVIGGPGIRQIKHLPQSPLLVIFLDNGIGHCILSV
jgi:hypothetical protein